MSGLINSGLNVIERSFVANLNELNNSANISNSSNLTSYNSNKERVEDSKLISIVEVIFDWFSGIIRFIGPLFFVALCLFVLLVASSFFSVILPYYDFDFFMNTVMNLVAIYLLIQIFFNYTLAYLVKPGSVADLIDSKYYKENDPYNNSNINLYQVFKNTTSNKIVEAHSKYTEVSRNICNINSTNNNNSSNNSITNTSRSMASNNTSLSSSSISEEVNNNNFKHCKYCDELKPLRAHHCSICKTCVFKMDHHCPWINNCVGQNNHRYFILFLTWIFIGCLFVLFTSLPIVFNKNNIEFASSRKKTEFNFIVVLCLAGSVILCLFNLWNWFLVLRGLTTIEFWMSKPKLSKNKYTVINDFSMGWENNFYMVFGTRNVFSAVFVPSVRKLPYSGLEWSKMVCENIKFKGLNDFNYNTLRLSDDIV